MERRCVARPGPALPVFEGGFAAVEAEFVFRLASDAPSDKVQWTPEEASRIAAAMHIGIETAGSPLALWAQDGNRVESGPRYPSASEITFEWDYSCLAVASAHSLVLDQPG